MARPDEFTGLRARLARKAATPPLPVRKRAALGPSSVPEPPDLREAVARMPDAGRSWTLLMPYGELLTSNQRLHHMAACRAQRRLRQEAAETARARGLPKLERAAIFYVLHPRPIKRNRDPGNWSVSAKAYVDGLVDAGLLPDDNSTHLAGPYPEIGPPVPSGGARMSLVIVELTPIEP
ncbi:hypothetical protein [Streptomyces sp. NPDC004435]|uniref:hypothetical protein n=1 Tax=Streptomyces sp. NPDC004435 TaxID=3364701 RepID=UPI0036CB238E